MSDGLLKIKISKMNQDTWEISAEPAKPGEFNNLTDSFQIYSEAAQGKEMEDVLRRIDFNYHKNFYVFGLRNTVLVEGVFRSKSVVSTVTVMEITDSDEIVLFGTDAFFNLLQSNRIEIIVGNAEYIISRYAVILRDVLKSYNMRNIEVITCPYIKSQYPDEMETLVKSLFEYLHYHAYGYGNSVEDILWGTDNLVNNWQYTIDGIHITPFKDVYKGVPAVIVGAGPSLDKNIEDIKLISDRAIILGVDACTKTLKRHGIQTDAITALERSSDPADFFRDYINESDTVFIGPNVVKNAVLSVFDKWIFTGRTGDGIFRAFNENIGFGNLDVGNNVSHVALAFAIHAGCSPIILVGLDLAFSGGETHIQDIVDEMDPFTRSIYLGNTTKVKGNDGTFLETYIEFMYARVWIEKLIDHHSETRFINATEGGAYIRGTEQMGLKEVINLLGDIRPIENRLNTLYKVKESERLDKLATTLKSIEFFEKLIGYSEEIKTLADDAKKDLTEKERYGRVARLLDNRMKIDIMLTQSPGIGFIYQPVFMNYNRDLHSFPIYLEEADEEGMVKRSLHYYDTLNKVSDKIKDSLEAYIQVLNHYKHQLETETV